MNTITIDSNIYKGAEMYAKLHKISIEAAIEKGLTLLLGNDFVKPEDQRKLVCSGLARNRTFKNLTPKKKVADEKAEFQKALAYVESLTVKGGKPVPADVDPMAVFEEEKYKLCTYS